MKAWWINGGALQRSHFTGLLVLLVDKGWASWLFHGGIHQCTYTDHHSRCRLGVLKITSVLLYKKKHQWWGRFSDTFDDWLQLLAIPSMMMAIILIITNTIIMIIIVNTSIITTIMSLSTVSMIVMLVMIVITLWNNVFKNHGLIPP